VSRPVSSVAQRRPIHYRDGSLRAQA
jgi:hypothetical protein